MMNSSWGQDEVDCGQGQLDVLSPTHPTLLARGATARGATTHPSNPVPVVGLGSPRSTHPQHRTSLTGNSHNVFPPHNQDLILWDTMESPHSHNKIQDIGPKNGIIKYSHGPIGGPVASASIGSEGGTLELYNNVMTIPEGALRETTKIEMGLVWNKALRPNLETEFQVSAILSCEPANVRFMKPAVLTLPHSLLVKPSRIKQLRPVLYSCHYLNNGKPCWERSRLNADNFTFTQHNLQVKVWDFCYLMVTLEDGTEVEAKKIWIVPYALPVTQDHLNIRFHVVAALDGMKEAVQNEEKGQGGKRLTACSSYALLKNFGNLDIETKWHSTGWVLTSPDIQMPFREMWLFDRNSCEMRVKKQGDSLTFHCNMCIQQTSNDSRMPLNFSHHVQMDAASERRKEEFQEEGEFSTNELSLPMRQSTPTPTINELSSLQLSLPEVPPPPCIPSDFLNGSLQRSISQAKPSPPKSLQSVNFASLNQADGGQRSGRPSHDTQRNVEVAHQISMESGDNPNSSLVPVIRQDPNNPLQYPVPGRIERYVTSENGGAITQYFIGNVTYVNRTEGRRMGDSIPDTPCVIALGLRNTLGAMLSERHVINWIDLARHWRLEERYGFTIAEKSPGFRLLTLAEERKVITSLGDVVEALKAIGRYDCVDIINKYIKEYPSSHGSGDVNDSSLEGLPEAAYIQKTSEKPSGLYHPGVDSQPAQRVPARGHHSRTKVTSTGSGHFACNATDEAASSDISVKACPDATFTDRRVCNTIPCGRSPKTPRSQKVKGMM